MLDLSESARKELEAFFLRTRKKAPFAFILPLAAAVGRIWLWPWTPRATRDQSEEQGRLYLLHQQRPSGSGGGRQH